MPITLLNEKESGIITRIKGSEMVHQHLHHLGFIEGETIEIVSKSGGNLIVSIKDVRIALSKELAKQIYV